MWSCSENSIHVKNDVSDEPLSQHQQCLMHARRTTMRNSGVMKTMAQLAYAIITSQQHNTFPCLKQDPGQSCKFIVPRIITIWSG
ncbi:hypothetical protein DPMN_059049 [Dreissena polymorpha]|uniref:Uncharacterized protein n=1 Tax=Dreissena polymorpha TaxID=45954 RepID=A0A9D4HG75_DREPO|nr:hypothetical protein DPMN_059049 [Dreissena polymorpha]